MVTKPFDISYGVAMWEWLYKGTAGELVMRSLSRYPLRVQQTLNDVWQQTTHEVTIEVTDVRGFIEYVVTPVGYENFWIGAFDSRQAAQDHCTLFGFVVNTDVHRGRPFIVQLVDVDGYITASILTRAGSDYVPISGGGGSTPPHDSLLGLHLAGAGVGYGHVSATDQDIYGVKTFKNMSMWTTATDYSYMNAGDLQLGKVSAVSQASLSGNGDLYLRNGTRSFSAYASSTHPNLYMSDGSRSFYVGLGAGGYTNIYFQGDAGAYFGVDLGLGTMVINKLANINFDAGTNEGITVSKSSHNSMLSSLDLLFDGVSLRTQVAGKEASLGNPSADGYVLSSTAGGVRSWISAAGGVTSHLSLTDVQQAASGVTAGHISDSSQTIYGAKTFDQPVSTTATTGAFRHYADQAGNTWQYLFDDRDLAGSSQWGYMLRFASSVSSYPHFNNRFALMASTASDGLVIGSEGGRPLEFYTGWSNVNRQMAITNTNGILLPNAVSVAMSLQLGYSGSNLYSLGSGSLSSDASFSAAGLSSIGDLGYHLSMLRADSSGMKVNVGVDGSISMLNGATGVYGQFMSVSPTYGVTLPVKLTLSNLTASSLVASDSSKGLVSYTLVAADIPDLSATYSPLEGSSSLSTAGTISTGVWHGTAVADAYIASAATWNGKQAAYTNLTSIGSLANAAGYLKNNGSGTFSYALPLLTDLSGTLGAGNGGTGKATYAVGDILYASAATTLTALTAVATGNALISGGVTTAPSWGKIGLTTHISGVLPVANGGTNKASYAVGDILYASAATTLTALTAVATGSAMISGGVTTAPSWGKIGLTTHITGVLPVANGGTNKASYAVGDILYASAATTLTALTAVATGNVMISGGVTTAPSWGKVGLTTHVSGTLPIANGGTGVTSFGAGGVLWTTSSATTISVAATGSITGVLTCASSVPAFSTAISVSSINFGGNGVDTTAYTSISGATALTPDRGNYYHYFVSTSLTLTLSIANMSVGDECYLNFRVATSALLTISAPAVSGTASNFYIVGGTAIINAGMIARRVGSGFMIVGVCP